MSTEKLGLEKWPFRISDQHPAPGHKALAIDPASRPKAWRSAPRIATSLQPLVATARCHPRLPVGCEHSDLRMNYKINYSTFSSFPSFVVSENSMQSPNSKQKLQQNLDPSAQIPWICHHATWQLLHLCPQLGQARLGSFNRKVSGFDHCGGEGLLLILLQMVIFPIVWAV